MPSRCGCNAPRRRKTHPKNNLQKDSTSILDTLPETNMTSHLKMVEKPSSVHLQTSRGLFSGANCLLVLGWIGIISENSKGAREPPYHRFWMVFSVGSFMAIILPQCSSSFARHFVHSLQFFASHSAPSFLILFPGYLLSFPKKTHINPLTLSIT